MELLATYTMLPMLPVIMYFQKSPHERERVGATDNDSCIITTWDMVQEVSRDKEHPGMFVQYMYRPESFTVC